MRNVVLLTNSDKDKGFFIYFILHSSRNESVLVVYSDGVCDTAWAQVTEDVQCACACQPLACSGLARVDNDTCTCVCAEETRDNTTCQESQTFSAHSCSCECEVVEADCPPPLFWSPDLCSCSIILTPEIILSLVIALLVILTLALIYCNIKYHIKVAYLQVNTRIRHSKKFHPFLSRISWILIAEVGCR